MSSSESAFEEALKFHRAGRLAEAEEIYRKVLDAQPAHFDSLRLLALIDHRRGNYMAALRLIEVALTVDPNSAEAFNSHGNTLRKMQRLDEALASYDKAIALKPSYAGAFNNRGTTLHELKRLDEALANFNQAIALNPGNAVAFNNRGNVFKELNRLDEALASYDQAIALRPNYADAYKNRGTALQTLGRLHEAVASYDQAIALNPAHAEAFNNRGSALHQLRRLDEALASYDQAIGLKPGFVNAFMNRGMTRLLDGRFREGWADYEWRLKVNGLGKRSPTIDAPTWHGEDLAGSRIAIYAEQGLGDVIQFVRYLPLLVRRGAKVTFLVPTKLVRLLRPMSAEIDVISSMDGRGPFDFQCALISLPLRFDTDLSSIPNEVPYLSAERDMVNRWATRLGVHGFKIGVAWQGIPERLTDRGRSIPLAEFVPLFYVPGVRLISLQKEHGLDQLASLPTDARLETLGDNFDSGPNAFIDTAAVMANLDLIISSDTSIAHLAGALARPTWVALKFVPDWRWLLGGEDCRWYPTMRLFRQETDGDWKCVFSRIEKKLRSAQMSIGSIDAS